MPVMRAPRSCKNLVVTYTQRLYDKDISDLLVGALLLLIHKREGFLSRGGLGGRRAGRATGLGAPVLDINETLIDFDGFIAEVVEEYY
jgi:hypothetical protein